MSDEMKLTSEDAKITAGMPRRDSAGAAVYRGSLPVFSSQRRAFGHGVSAQFPLATRAGIAALGGVGAVHRRFGICFDEWALAFRPTLLSLRPRKASESCARRCQGFICRRCRRGEG